MKFFEAIPSELFSPLASPNRALYADALDVLYSAYRDNLKIREDALYSMLRSKLEEQLADATFEGEDIDADKLVHAAVDVHHLRQGPLPDPKALRQGLV